MAWLSLLVTAGFCVTSYGGQSNIKGLTDRLIDKYGDELKAMNRSIWSQPEVGLQEAHAVDVLSNFLTKNGFSVKVGVAGLPTAFVATAGSGQPLIGIFAEYDALPGLSQAAVPVRKIREGALTGSKNDIGHGCGHSVYGVGSVGAAVAAYQAIKDSGKQGTVKLYGTPAEETMIGKVFMARAGLFDDIDVALHWHVSQSNGVMFGSSKAAISVKFRFIGKAAHASVNPESGRSALDAVQLMNIGVNYLREHLRQDVRIHYVITSGGAQPNVVPSNTEVWYYIRADDQEYTKYVYKRIVEVANGAAIMAGTDLVPDPVTNVFPILVNRPLSELLYDQFKRVGSPHFTAEDKLFGQHLQKSYGITSTRALAETLDDLPEFPYRGRASSDVGNVSWRVPTAGIYVAAVPKKIPMHSWGVVASTGSSIGERAMITAARVLAGTVCSLVNNPIQLTKIQKSFTRQLKERRKPVSILPLDHKPPKEIR